MTELAVPSGASPGAATASDAALRFPVARYADSGAERLGADPSGRAGELAGG